MPTYEYRCENGHSFEEFQSILAAPVEVCPICGAHAERQLSGGSGLIFKGSGFYITDYAHKKASPYARDAAAASSHSDAAEKKPSESKPVGSPSTPTKKDE